MVVAILSLGLAYAPLLPPVTRFELQLARRNGEVFRALLSSTLVTLQGQPYTLATVQHIMERRRLEALEALTRKVREVRDA